ncbi:hypothetical protein AMTRI_Chr09g16460 [Amborella trichopoda]|uniref:Cytochrome P450 n=1 Tax=Amborella trichopoda TaxID=13333 RepID=W1NMS0_AMBTC|nr:cytochrome P450 84A1 [Amborella trichopoda]ERM96575.1 hypothetical protein AMTR_s00001p00269980 [Amborella trichopoda]|eukprot:XP_006829159.1 cytochrome P450 84A1 [Amborella trichopoda]
MEALVGELKKEQLGLALLLGLPFVYLLWRLAVGRKRPLPPGPRPRPIVGNMALMDQLTHRGLAKLARPYGGLMYLRLGFMPNVVVSTPEMAKQVLQVQDNTFSNRPATIAIQYLTYDRADMAFAHYGPFWRQMRKLCVMKLFSRRRPESWRPVREEVDAMVKAVATKAKTEPGMPVNVGELVFGLTRNITFKAAFGSALGEGQDMFNSLLQEFSRLFGAFNIGDFLPVLSWMDLQGINKRLRNARQSLDHFIDKIIDDHMASAGQKDERTLDMVDDMLVHLGDGPASNDDTDTAALKLTRDNIKAIIMDVMFGGTETVASAIEWAMAELMHNPQEMQKVQDELKKVVGLNRQVQEGDLENLTYLKCVVKEVLRLHPPIPLLLHETAEETEVSGYRIPKQCRVMINVWAIGRDPKSWPDPDAFKPERFTKENAYDFKGSCFEFLPFGSGRRSCPGMQLGLYGLEMAVAHLVHSFDWSLPDGMKSKDMDMSDSFGLTAPKAQRLVALATVRLSCDLLAS